MFFFGDNTLDFKQRSIEQGYYLIINEDLISAQAVFASLDSPRSRWGKILCDILNGRMFEYPSYFEIRNFLEIDLDFLLKNEKIDYVEQLLGSLDILIKINQESYKYVARVMFENKFYNACYKYLEKSKDVFYSDPELHFMFTKYYLHLGDYIKANKHIVACLNILPDYFPAKKLQIEIESHLA